MTAGCVQALTTCLAPERKKRHEGIAYLYGQTDGVITLAIGAIRPEAETTRGSFYVSPQAMAKIVRSVCDMNLKVIGQIHTHPGEAYHSDGDNEGARIAYSGYTSVVLPEYGRYLPNLTGAAIYMYQSKQKGFVELSLSDAIIVAEKL
jgi:proteasome lid subunit RPN8/RPN11